MKEFIKDESNTKDEFIVECSCGSCGLIKIAKFWGDYDLIYYTSKRHHKRNKHSWDIVLTKDEIKDMVANLQEMLGHEDTNSYSADTGKKATKKKSKLLKIE